MFEQTKYIIVYNKGIQDGPANDLIRKLDVLVKKNIKDVTILISSSGGSLETGFMLYNYIRSLPLTVTTHNMSMVSSTANLLFLAGKIRYALEHAGFLYHEVTWNFGKVKNIPLSQLKESVSALDNYVKMMVNITCQATSLSEAEVYDWIKDKTTRNSQYALSKQIIHQIKPMTFPKKYKLLQIGEAE